MEPSEHQVFTFLFTDIEGSTRHWEFANLAMHAALARHDAIVRAAIESSGGHVVAPAGDGFLTMFQDAAAAVASAVEIHQALASQNWDDTGRLRVRVAIHTGEAFERDGNFFGPTLNRASRILALTYGDQTLISNATLLACEEGLSPTIAVRDMGVHRLRDLQEPERIWQVDLASQPMEFPPLRSLDSFPNNLPQFLSSFVGRDDELQSVVDRLRETRLLTLTGFGGCGKTRLALQAAANMQEAFPDGIWLVRLESLADRSLVAQHVASTLHAREVPTERAMHGIEASPTDAAMHKLIHHLHGSKLLLILDNCEHLLAECANLVTILLPQCPRLTVLATSREAFAIAGEAGLQVPPLGIPPAAEGSRADELVRFESVRLFAERAHAMQSHFQITDENAAAVSLICRRLDGIPLAIELAAARIRALSVDQIAHRIEQRFSLLTGGRRDALPRHQTLRALIEWSCDLLNPAEMSLLMRLAVFQSGWTLEACEQIAESDLPAIDLLTALVDKSLVTCDYRESAYRYSLLETVHEYCSERLTASGEEQVARERHMDYYCALAVRLAPLLAKGDSSAFAQMETEHNNVRAALDYCLSRDEGDPSGLTLACAMQRFWEVRGHCHEGRGYFQALLGRAGSDITDKQRADALTGAGILAFRGGDFDAARDLHAQSLKIWIDQDEGPSIAEALVNLGNVAEDIGDFDEARRLYEEAVAISRRLGNTTNEALYVANLASATAMLGNLAAASHLASTALALARKAGNKRGIGFALYVSGLIAYRSGKFDTSRHFHQEAMAVWQEIGSRLGIVFTLEAFFELAAAAGEMTKAARLLGASESLRQIVGEPVPPARAEEYALVAGKVRAMLGETAFAETKAAGQALSVDGAISETSAD